MEPLPGTAQRSDERFAWRFRERAGGDGPISFASFMDLALFDPEVGYYAVQRARVGKAAGTDFYTATTFAGVFAPLVLAAIEHLLTGQGLGATADHAFVEIGAEPERALLDGVAHPFAATQTLRLGSPLVLPRRAVVFSNELFDAQPFHRLIWREGRWREAGVRLSGGELGWEDLPNISPELDAVRTHLPAEADEGYVLDVPWRAARLLASIAALPWTGLFVACDYGRTWRQIAEDFPQGTGRGYLAHKQAGDLLASPGEQDLTCHVCWDWLEAALRDAGFRTVQRESQESFFMNRATAAIEAIMRSDPNPWSPARSQLKQLLHPGFMGQRFEVLWGVRTP